MLFKVPTYCNSMNPSLGLHVRIILSLKFFWHPTNQFMPLNESSHRTVLSKLYPLSEFP